MPGWRPFGPPELELWVGPNLAVAERIGGGGWRLRTARDARDLLVRHALQRSPAIDRALNRATADTPLGTPFDRAVWAHRHALPEFACVIDPQGPTASFLRSPEAVLQLGVDRFGALDWGLWRTGADALDLLSRHRATTQAEATGDVLLLRPEAPEGVTLRRALALGLGGLALAPALAVPLLAANAVLWMVGIAALWVAGLAAGPTLLRAWNRRRPQPALRLDPWRLWLPSRLGPPVVDRATIRASLSWRPAFGTANTGIAGRAPSVRNPAMTFLHLTGPDLNLTLGCAGMPPDPGAIPKAGAHAHTGVFAAIPSAALWTLAQQLGRPDVAAHPADRRAPGTAPIGRSGPGQA